MKFIDVLKHYRIPISGIVHIGACNLEEAEEYRDAGLEHVIWVEAQSHDAKRLARAKSFGHELLEGCPLSDRAERVQLHIANNAGGGSSSLMPLKEHARLFPEIQYTGEIVTLNALRGDEVLAGIGPEYDALVIDVQGYELRVLEGLRKLIDQFRVAWLEVAIVELYEGQALMHDVQCWMRQHGFQGCAYYSHPSLAWGDAFFWRTNDPALAR